MSSLCPSGRKTVLVDGGSPVALKGGEGTRFIYNLLPVGKFYDKRYGELYVDDRKLHQMEQNFGKYPAYKVPVKIGHGDGAPSPGEVIAARATDRGLEITMSVDKETSESILKKQYRYMSAEFDENYMDKETGESVGSVLLGAALVNQPANPYMEPLVLVDDIEAKNDSGNTIIPDRRNDGMAERNEVVELLQKQLSDAEARAEKAREELESAKKAQDDRDAEAKSKEDEAQRKIAELEAAAKARDEDAQRRIAELEAANKALSEEKAAAETAKAEADVKAFCDEWAGKGVPPAVLEKVKPILLSEGKPSVIKLSDTDETPLIKVFGEVFEGMNKVPMGQIGSGDAGAVELSDVDKARSLGQRIAATVNGPSEPEKR